MFEKYFIRQKNLKDTFFIRFLRLDDENLQVFKYLCIFSGFYLASLVLANCYYIDDVGRFANTDFNWMKDGRPLMQLMAKIIGFGKPYLDIFPVGLVLASIVFNYALVLWGRKYFGIQLPLKVSGLLALSYLNLFLLENFSYVYESLGMFLSLGIPILLYAFPDIVSSSKKFILTVFFVVLSLAFYQASIGAYIGLALIELLYGLFQQQEQRKILRLVGTRFSGIVVGVGVYLACIAHFLVKGYGAEHGSLIPLFTYQGCHQLLNHLSIYYQRYQTYFLSVQIVILVLVLIILIGGSCVFLKNLYRKQELNVAAKTAYTLLIILLPALFMICAIAPFTLLKEPVYAPRIFLSFTVFFMYLAILLNQFDSKFYLVKFFMIPLLLFAVSFAVGYGNVLHRENLHDQYIAQSITYDLNQLENKTGNQYKGITIIGREPESLELQKQKKKRPLMGLLVPIYMSNDWYWGGRYLDHYRNVATKLLAKTPQDELSAKNRDPDITNEFYNLYANNEKAIIVFKESSRNK